MKKVIFAIIIVLAIFITGTILIYYPAFPHNKNKAKEIAMEYVNKNFEQEMECLAVNVSVWENVLYSVYFSPVNSPDIVFEVMISDKFELPDHPDNYVMKRFEKEMYGRLEPLVKSLWGTEGKTLLISSQPLFGFRIEEGLDENSTFDDIQGKLDYSLSVTINENVNDPEWQTEFVKIYDFINAMQKERYMFEEVIFYYNDKAVELKNWQDIKDISEIEENAVFSDRYTDQKR